MEHSILLQFMKKPIPKTRQSIEIIFPAEEGVEVVPPPHIDIVALRERLKYTGRVRKKKPSPSVSTSAEDESEEHDEQKEEQSQEVPPPSSDKDESEEEAEILSDLTPEAQKKKKKKKKKIAEEEDELPSPNLSLVINGKTVRERMPRIKEKFIVTAPSYAYYMNNRKYFNTFITKLLHKYRQELLGAGDDISCDRSNVGFALLTHQKLVRDYINRLTPYRGLLVYHGLGSGKTCTSIAVAEGLKDPRRIIIMTPASLQMNYQQELRKCGDALYKINQHWEFVSTNGDEELENTLASLLSLSKKFIKKAGGAWFVNIKRKPNFARLNATKKKSVDKQVQRMIDSKYFFINYNGLRNNSIHKLRSVLRQPNLFDNAVVIIDEVHNFVSRIVNKLKKPKSLSMKLYHYLKASRNCKIICLTGTPIINYPNELGVLFNILRGNIITYSIPVTIKTQIKIDEKKMIKILNDPLCKTVDYIRYQSSLKQLLLTRNPFGFINATTKSLTGSKIYDDDVENMTDGGHISDDTFIDNIVTVLRKHNIDINKRQIKIKSNNTALPDKLEDFTRFFINKDTGLLKNENIFKKRILGLTSHFTSPQEQLMPEFNKETSLHIEEIPMSNYQLGIYTIARQNERDEEKNRAKRKRRQKANKGGELYGDTASTYRIFSRAFCNFVFPVEIQRPLPNQDQNLKDNITNNIDEALLDNISAEEKVGNINLGLELDDISQIKEKGVRLKDKSYEQRIQTALHNLYQHKEQYLTPQGLEELSPKFLTILNNIQTLDGLHLIYSQFRTLEGIGILKLILETNGFAQLKISRRKHGGSWHLNMSEADKKKPKFILYTGTEDAEEKEIMRNIFNSTWKNITKTLRKELKAVSGNNFHGEIAKVFMITAAGAEGISLKNVRYVHITEPYWHPVRLEQVIGRARRICSHQDLPPDERKIEVYIYLMKFSEQQINENILDNELQIKDVSREDRETPFTSDQTLFEISQIKRRINDQLLKAIKEASIDCALQIKEGGEDLTCFSFTRAKKSEFIQPYPELTGANNDNIEQANKRKEKVKIVNFTFKTVKYAWNKTTNEIYDHKSYLLSKKNKKVNPIVLGTMILEKKTGNPIKPNFT